MEQLRIIPDWDKVSATLKSDLGYAEATVLRTKTIYQFFAEKCCNNEEGDAESTIEAGIKTAGILYEGKTISYSRLTRLRRLGFYLLEYVRTGTMSETRVPPYGQRYGNDEHELLLSKFIHNEQVHHSHAESIISRDKCLIRIFLIYVEEHGYLVDTITASEMIDFLKYMKARRPAGIKSTVSALRHFYLFLINDGMADDRILSSLKAWGPKHHKVYGLLTEEEKRRIIEVIDTETGKRDMAIFLLAMDCGLRSSDICTLKLSEIDWHNAAINIIQQKTKEQVAVPISFRTGNALADYIMSVRGDSDLPYVFIKKSFSGTPMTSSLLCGRLKKLMRLAGINRPASEKINMHTFRRSLGTALIDSGEDMELVAQVLGHKDIEATKVYISSSERQLRMCPLKMPERMNGGVC